MADTKKLATIQLDQAEIAVRIIEAMTGSDRPANMTATQAVECLAREDQERLADASSRVAEYFFEQMKLAIPGTQVETVVVPDNLN